MADEMRVLGPAQSAAALAAFAIEDPARSPRPVPPNPSAPELLYSTTDPYEVPLVMPAWARSLPALAKRIDDGYALRHSAGLPVDGSLPGDRPGYP